MSDRVDYRGLTDGGYRLWVNQSSVGWNTHVRPPDGSNGWYTKYVQSAETAMSNGAREARATQVEWTKETMDDHGNVTKKDLGTKSYKVKPTVGLRRW